MAATDVEEAIISHFSAYYNGDFQDELLAVGIPLSATRSAGDFVRIFGDGATKIASLMRGMAADPEGPQEDLRLRIERASIRDWTGEPGLFENFQQLATSIANEIDRILAT